MSDTIQLTDAQLAEMRRLKSYFPYRIVYGAINPTSNEFVSGAVVTMRQPNDYARKGWIVFKLGTA